MAQPTGRVGRATVRLAHGRQAELAALWLSPRTAFVPDWDVRDDVAVESVNRLCFGERCAVVVAMSRCEVPRCPAAGHLAEAEAPLASVSPWPTDERGYQAALAEVRADAAARPLRSWLRAWAPAPAPSRAGHGGREGELGSPVLWLTPRVAFSNVGPLEIVCDGDTCGAVVAREPCGPPDCPERGVRLRTAERIAEVVPWAAADYDLEMARLRADPDLSRPGGYYGPPPGSREEMPDSLAPPGPRGPADIEPTAWTETRRVTLGVELDGAFTVGSFVEDGGTWLGASAGLALQLELDRANSGGPFDALLFDGAGFGVHANFLSRVDTPDGQYLFTVGAGVVLTHRVASTPVRLPTVLGALLPEAGAVFRSDGTSAGYVGWALPLSLLLVEHLALDLRPRVLVTLFPEGSGRVADVFVGISVGLVAAQLGAELPRVSPGGGLLSL